MKIKKGTLVLLLKKGIFGSNVPPETPLGQCFGLVVNVGNYNFGTGFEVKTFTGKKRIYVCKKEYLIPLTQVKPKYRKAGIKYLLDMYNHLIISRAAYGILNIHESLS